MCSGLIIELVLSINLNKYFQPCAGKKILQVYEVNHTKKTCPPELY